MCVFFAKRKKKAEKQNFVQKVETHWEKKVICELFGLCTVAVMDVGDNAIADLILDGLSDCEMRCVWRKAVVNSGHQVIDSIFNLNQGLFFDWFLS